LTAGQHDDWFHLVSDVIDRVHGRDPDLLPMISAARPVMMAARAETYRQPDWEERSDNSVRGGGAGRARDFSGGYPVLHGLADLGVTLKLARKDRRPALPKNGSFGDETMGIGGDLGVHGSWAGLSGGP
jgi:hypothetical protein